MKLPYVNPREPRPVDIIQPLIDASAAREVVEREEDHLRTLRLLGRELVTLLDVWEAGAFGGEALVKDWIVASCGWAHPHGVCDGHPFDTHLRRITRALHLHASHILLIHEQRSTDHEQR